MSSCTSLSLRGSSPKLVKNSRKCEVVIFRPFKVLFLKSKKYEKADNLSYGAIGKEFGLFKTFQSFGQVVFGNHFTRCSRINSTKQIPVKNINILFSFKNVRISQ